MRDTDDGGGPEDEPIGFRAACSFGDGDAPDREALLDFEPLRDRRRPSERPDDRDPILRSGEGDPSAIAGGLGRSGDWDADDLFDALGDRRRRVALHYLRDRGGAAPFEDVAAAVAERTPADGSEYDHRRSVERSLYHVHLPKLEDVGLVAHSDPEGEVRLSDRVAGTPWSPFGPR